MFSKKSDKIILIADTVSLPIGECICTVNQMYLPRSSRKSAKAWFYLNPVVKEYKEIFKEIARLTDLVKARDYKDFVHYVSLDVIFLLSNNSLWDRDTTNMIKPTEDALVEVTGIDDSRHKPVRFDKENSIDGREHVLVGLELHLK